MHDAHDIDPERLYSFSEAADLIPSSHKHKHVTPKTLHNWRRAGRIQGVPRPSGGKTFWFIVGAELLRLLGGPVEFNGETPVQRQRGQERTRQMLRERHGLKV